MGTGLTALAAQFRADMVRLVPQVLDERDFNGRDLIVAVQELERTTRTLTSVSADVVHCCDDQTVYVFDGHRSINNWVAATVDQSGAATGRLVGLSRFLADCPDVAALLAAGELSVDHVHKLAAIHRNPRVRHLAGDAMELLVNVARAETYDVFVTFVDNWVELHDQNGPHRPDGEAHQQRRVSLVSVGDRYLLKGEWGAVEGAAMQEIFEQYCHAEYLADRDAVQRGWQADGNAGPAPDTMALPRNQRQRSADAVEAMFFAAATAPPDGIDPIITINLDVLIDNNTFERNLDRLTTPRISDPTVEQALAELIDPLRTRHTDHDFDTSDTDQPCSYATERIDRLGVSRLVDGTVSVRKTPSPTPS